MRVRKLGNHKSIIADDPNGHETGGVSVESKRIGRRPVTVRNIGNEIIMSVNEPDSDLLLNLLEKIANAKGVDPMVLEPLGDRIDTDALRLAVESATIPLTIELTVYGCDVAIERSTGGDVSITATEHTGGDV